MSATLIFTKADWLEQAKLLLPDLTDAQREALWANVERLDAEHKADAAFLRSEQ